MSDDKKDRGSQDRTRVADEQPYEVAYFADKHGIDLNEARRIIKQHGPSREACDRAVARGR
jgi:hypothetical protein